MKDILFKILVVLLSPVYFMFWIFANVLGLAMELGKEIGEPIANAIQEKIEKMSSFWKEFFKRKK